MIIRPLKIRLAALIVSGALLCHALTLNVSGCCVIGEPEWLEDGSGSIILHSAPFFFELEMRELAKQFPSKYKALPPRGEDEIKRNNLVLHHEAGLYQKQSGDADLDDFAKAFPDDAEAQARHRAAREFIDSGADGDTPLAAELPGEFADYHRGALMFKRENFAAASEAWKNLLARPTNERRWRSTWAAFMLGKIALREKNYAAAKKFFQQTRKLADAGFVDSLALAAASLGWEAKAHLEEKNYEQAARLYLQQLSSGDETAHVSLRVLSGAPLERYAKDPVLRKIFVADVLANGSGPYESIPVESETPAELNWLKAFEKSGANDIDDADALAWIAYQNGRFDLAKRWLKFAGKPTGLSLWLRAKLAFRDGDIDDAIKLMERAARHNFSDDKPRYYERYYLMSSQHKAVYGDLGLLQLANGAFENAFLSFINGGHKGAASYVGERVLSPEEFAKLIDQNFFPQKPPADNRSSYFGYDWLGNNKAAFAREILARRLTRLERFDEAQKYFAADMQGRFAKYANAAKAGKNPRLPKGERAKALMLAAELTDVDLVGRWTPWPNGWPWQLWDIDDYRNGHVESSVYWDRLYGKLGYFSVNGRLQKPKKTAPLTLPVSKAERQRLEKFAEPPEIRDYRYYIAAQWDWQAAKLLPADDELTAQVLNRGGWRVHAHYDTLADKFYEEILRRCPNTETGRAVAKKRWFVQPE